LDISALSTYKSTGHAHRARARRNRLLALKRSRFRELDRGNSGFRPGRASPGPGQPGLEQLPIEGAGPRIAGGRIELVLAGVEIGLVGDAVPRLAQKPVHRLDIGGIVAASAHPPFADREPPAPAAGEGQPGAQPPGAAET